MDHSLGWQDWFLSNLGRNGSVEVFIEQPNWWTPIVRRVIGDCRWQFALLSDKCNNRVSGGKYNKTEWCWWRVCIRWYEAITAETEEYFTINWWIKLASKSEWTDVNGMSRALSPRYYRMLSVYSEVTSNGTTKYTPLHQVTRCRCRVTVAPELTCRTPIAPKIHNNSKDEHLMCN
jgi:hypothetical protein